MVVAGLVAFHVLISFIGGSILYLILRIIGIEDVEFKKSFISSALSLTASIISTLTLGILGMNDNIGQVHFILDLSLDLSMIFSLIWGLYILYYALMGIANISRILSRAVVLIIGIPTFLLAGTLIVGLLEYLGISLPSSL